MDHDWAYLEMVGESWTFLRKFLFLHFNVFLTNVWVYMKNISAQFLKTSIYSYVWSYPFTNTQTE